MVYRLDQAKVLIVDDMEPMRELASSVLETFGCKMIYTATNIDDAFDLYQQHSPDFVLTDWMLETGSGLDLTELIRRDPLSKNPYVPIILMTGFSHKLRVMEARDIGVTEFLVKPFTARDLYSRLVQVIERPRQFVNGGEFFGPDRRRNRKKNPYEGPPRRYSDSEAVANAIAAEGGSAEHLQRQEILKQARQTAKNASKSD